MGVISVSLPSDGSTADVADINTPITTIINSINGNLDSSNLADNAVNTAKLAAAAVTATKLGFTVSSQTNSGTAGGTIYYINLGGIKLCWGVTATQSSGSPGNQFTVVFPASFFTTIQTATTTPTNMSAVIQQQANISGFNTTALTIYFTTTTAATMQVSYLVIGI